MNHRLTKIKVAPTSKTMAILYAIFGLIYIPVGFLANLTLPEEESIPMLLWFIFPVLFAIFGYVFVALGCALYNVVSGWTGGIEVVFEVEEDESEMVV